MNPAYISAFFGLAGVVVGGLTSFMTGWLTQEVQLRDKRREALRVLRRELFRDFIGEASRLYADALSHEKDDVGDVVELYALIANMRLLASNDVVAAAEEVLDVIIETYLAPNRSLHELRTMAR